MISKPLLKATIKQNFMIFLIILAVLMLYLPIIIAMYDPATQDSLEEVLNLLPQGLISAMGFNNLGTSLLDFISSYFYGLLILLLPMIYTIIICNRSIASHVDKGSMAYLLSTANKRTTIARTQALFIIVSTSIMIGIVTLVGIILSNIMFPGKLDVPGFLLLNLGALLLYYSITGIGFFASCLFNDTKNSLMIGAGIPVAFLVIQMISDIGEKTSFLKYFTLFTLYDPSKIISGDSCILQFITLIIIAVLMYTIGIYVFDKRDLPL
ncbi:ABC transporter permease subunit [Herbinix luporum]|jgi:ABC-2 type transport system permease protein|uniref:Putative membrane protein n=1 Tax=Herbinix luporum TaxID=1679721 RepID=A0A0K8J7Q8_9FIRM|nr:ABC transporter permease subunit [Herbinix luporum]MDI9489537.1 ABC transporter permease subunit [Bacillota bacterium]CUH93479.1 putative membrane protein [Herbinix luporum]HHT56363.1 ABC transporter permease subunit [Herbinix luporum]